MSPRKGSLCCWRRCQRQMNKRFIHFCIYHYSSKSVPIPTQILFHNLFSFVQQLHFVFSCIFAFPFGSITASCFGPFCLCHQQVLVRGWERTIEEQSTQARERESVIFNGSRPRLRLWCIIAPLLYAHCDQMLWFFVNLSIILITSNITAIPLMLVFKLFCILSLFY